MLKKTKPKSHCPYTCVKAAGQVFIFGYFWPLIKGPLFNWRSTDAQILIRLGGAASDNFEAVCSCSSEPPELHPEAAPTFPWFIADKLQGSVVGHTYVIRYFTMFDTRRWRQNKRPISSTSNKRADHSHETNRS